MKNVWKRSWPVRVSGKGCLTELRSQESIGVKRAARETKTAVGRESSIFWDFGSKNDTREEIPQGRCGCSRERKGEQTVKRNWRGRKWWARPCRTSWGVWSFPKSRELLERLMPGVEISWLTFSEQDEDSGRITNLKGTCDAGRPLRKLSW